MREATLYRQQEINEYIACKSIIQKIETLQEERQLNRKEDPKSYDEELVTEYNNFQNTEFPNLTVWVSNFRNVSRVEIQAKSSSPTILQLRATRKFHNCSQPRQ